MKMLNACALIVLAALTGCKENVENISVNPNPPFRMGEPLSEARTLTQAEITIAKRICHYLESKRLFLETLMSGREEFYFRSSETTCEGQTLPRINYSLAIKTDEITGPRYVSSFSNLKYVETILTDESPILYNVCKGANNNSNDISNQLNLGIRRYQVRFLYNNGFDTVEIVKAPLRQNIVEQLDVVSFVTQTYQTTSSKFYGVEANFVRSTLCENKNRTNVFTQTWLGPKTRF